MKVEKYVHIIIGASKIKLDTDTFINCIKSLGGRTECILDECDDEVVKENSRITELGFDDVEVKYCFLVDEQKVVRLSIHIEYDKNRKQRVVLFNDMAYTRDLKDVAIPTFIVSELSYFNNSNLPKSVSEKHDILLDMYDTATKEAAKLNQLTDLINENANLRLLIDKQEKLMAEMITKLQELSN